MEIMFIVAIVIGFYMAWNIGANDVANAMGTSVGSKALTVRRAIILAAVFELAGAILVGTSVTDTVRKGIIDPLQFSANPQLLVYGMMAALLASALWLNLASIFGQPVSTTHSIVGAVFGFGFVAGGAVSWGMMGKIVSSWLISPIASGVLAFYLFRFVTKKILAAAEPNRAAIKYAPFFAGVVGFMLTLSFIYKGLKNLHLDLSFGNALLISLVVGLLMGLISRKIVIKEILTRNNSSMDQEFVAVERVFVYLQIITACYVAFAHGANDVANAVGPLAAIHSVLKTGVVTMTVGVPLWIVALGGVGIVVGLATYGKNVMNTIGKKITEITPSRGFCAEFAAATTVLICSKMGIPISTTHSLVGAVIGVGMARGIGGLNINVVKSIITSWVITVPITALLTAVLYLLIQVVV